MKKHSTLALAVLMLCPNLVWAQSAVTFEQALASTLSSHPVIQGKRSAQVAAQADRKGAEWLRYPTPSIEATTQGSGNDNGLLRLDQPLWTGGRITAAIDAAGSRLSSADAAVEESTLDLSLRVIAVYSEALRQQAKMQYAQSGVDEHEKLLGMIRRRVEHEVSSQTDQRLAESRLYQAVNDLALTKQAYRNAIAQLGQLCGCAVDAISERGVSAQLDAQNLDDVLSEALAYSPALRRLKFDEEAADADIAAKRSAYSPQLSLRLEKSAGDVQTSRALLVLQAQPGAGLSAISGVDAAIARREAARMAREAAERDARDRATLDWNEWQSARLRFDNSKLSRTMSTQVFESYARQYAIGRKSWIEVLNAVREASLAEFSLEDARSQMVAASLRLRAQTGKLTMNEGLKP
ncbi:MAG: TolC family protein [Gallionella sp.]|nr:TolC family protein [Gallionella sp.]